jgi:hypothetical protein
MMKFTASALAFAASASAHMILEYPVPYGSPNSSPLSAADFPCKASGSDSYTVTTPNEWNAGETKEISFIGSAVHGGGSCQFSITTDLAPTKETQWKVIHSVIGNCPSDVTGNLPEDPSGHGASKFPVTLPADLPSGEYSFAWTWLNKIGNREFYMNCAPITVGGGGEASSKDVSSVLGSLPDMFVANLPDTQCSTTEGQDFVYPNPGDSVQQGTAVALGSDLKDNGGCASMTAMGAGNGQMGSPSEPTGAPVATEAPASTSPAKTTAAPTAVPSNPGGIFAPGASSVAATAPAAEPTAVTPPSNNTPTNGESVACDTDGAVVCIGSDKFGLCNQGFAYPMALSAGTTCTNGVISRRSVKFPRAHLHRRHGSGLL